MDFVAEEETDDPESGDNAEEWVLPDTTNRAGGSGSCSRESWRVVVHGDWRGRRCWRRSGSHARS